MANFNSQSISNSAGKIGKDSQGFKSESPFQLTGDSKTAPMHHHIIFEVLQYQYIVFEVVVKE